jgi:hypothetical protein
MSQLATLQPRLKAGVLAAGYAGVEIDPAGYRSPGN